MNQPNILLLVLSLLTISCGNLGNKELAQGYEHASEAAGSVEMIVPKMADLPANLDTKFETFLHYFNQDSLFQVSRIDFPLKVKVLDADNDYELVERTIQRSDYKKLDFTYDEKTSEASYYEQKIMIDGNKAVIEIRGIDNGVLANYFFEKKNGKWKLLTWTDSST